MLNIIGGPAQGRANGLCINRAPLYLRITRDTTYASAVCKRGRSEYDALDALEDSPRRHEEIFAYRRVGEAGSIHLNRRVNGRSASGTFVVAEYHYVEVQPADEVMRDTVAWRQWCAEQVKEEAENAD